MSFHMRQIILIFLMILQARSSDAQGTLPQLDLATPSDAMWVHLNFLQSDSYEPGISATAFSGSDSLTRVDLAVQLKQIYDGSGLYVHINQVPQDPDYVDSISQEHFYTPFPKELPQIYLEKIGDRWFYAQEASESIDQLHKDIYPFGTDALVTFFGTKSSRTFLGISVWQYAGVFILLAICLLAYFLLTYLFRFLIRRLSGIASRAIPEFVSHVRKIANLASFALVLWIVRILLPLLQLPVQATAIVHKSLRIAATFLIVLVLLRVVNLITAYLVTISARTESRMDDQFIPILKQITKVIIVVIGVLHILNLLDFNITALIAGLSIGGLALALAAQDTVKNFLGSVMIFADRPFQIGDFVEGAGFVGTVVEVGFRSTRIKTSDTSIISVPNGNMANASVTNKGVREYRLFSTTLGITYDTPPDLLEAFTQGVKDIMTHHPQVSNDDIYVRFVEFGASSLNIFVRAYMAVPGYAEELEIKESINLALLRWAETLGVQFAFPTTTMQIETFPGQTGTIASYEKDPEIVEEKWKRFLADFLERNKENTIEKA